MYAGPLYGLGLLPNLRWFLSFLALPTVSSSASGFVSGPLEDDPKAVVGVGARLLAGVGAIMVIGIAWLCCAERDNGGRVGRSPALLSRRW